ncbi:MAG: DNA primase [Patescibacteria group bacterium]
MNDTDEVKRRLNIIDLVQSYVPLKKTGATWKALCPFHLEKSPSFTVNQDRQTYKCFGCSEGGDVIDFVMKMEHLTFPEALQLLADRVGVVLDKRKTPTQYAQEKDEKSRLYQINRLATEVYHKIFKEGKTAVEARAYLANRGLSDETVATFKIGYAPTVVRGVPSILERFLTKNGFRPAELRQAGSPERFSNRLIFPLWDTLANPIGFTGRALNPDDQPKYLNTPETLLFKKSRVLYPLHRAKDGIKATGRAILVEGQMDVLLAHQLGSTEAVATSGTALTTDHLEILRRYTTRILFAFDADSAGIEATRKAILLAYDLELDPAVVVLPSGYKDLGELAVKDPAAWTVALEKVLPAVTWQLRMATQIVKEPTSAVGKKQIAAQVLPVLARIVDPIERAHWTQVLARSLGVPERTVAEALARDKKTVNRDQRNGETKKAPAEPVERLTPEEMLLGLLLIHPDQLVSVATRIEERDFPPVSRSAHLAKAIAICYTQDEPKDTQALLAGVKKYLDPVELKWVDSLVTEAEQLHTSADEQVIGSEIRAGFDRLRDKRLEGGKVRMAQEIADAEASGDRTKVQQLLKELQEMLK